MTVAIPCPPVPRSPWRSHAMRIASVRDEAPAVRTYALVFRDCPVAYDFAAGQFNMLLLPGIGEAAISIASAPASRGPRAPRGTTASSGQATPIEHTVRAVGNVTLALGRLGPGAEVFLRGPFGRPWPLADLRGRDLVIVGGGVGLATLRSAILAVAAQRGDFGRVTVIHGAKTPADLLYGGEYEAWRAAGIDVTTVVNRADAAWAGPIGLVVDPLDALDLATGSTTVLACGPEPMLHAVAEHARNRGIAAADVLVSMERNMACAAGFCGLCQFGPAFVCKDGPVFSWAAIARFLAVPYL